MMPFPINRIGLDMKQQVLGILLIQKCEMNYYLGLRRCLLENIKGYWVLQWCNLLLFVYPVRLLILYKVLIKELIIRNKMELKEHREQENIGEKRVAAGVLRPHKNIQYWTPSSMNLMLPSARRTRSLRAIESSWRPDSTPPSCTLLCFAWEKCQFVKTRTLVFCAACGV